MNAAVCGVPVSGLAYVLAGALVVAVVVVLARGGGAAVAVKSSRGGGLLPSLILVAAVVVAMCQLSAWVGLTRFAVVGFSAAALVVGVVAFALVGSIRSGRYGARVSAVLDQIATEDESAPVWFDGPEEDEPEVPALVDEQDDDQEAPKLAPVIRLRAVA